MKLPGFIPTCPLGEAPDKVSEAHNKTPPDIESLGWVLDHMGSLGMRNKPPSLGLLSSWIHEPSWEVSSSSAATFSWGQGCRKRSNNSPGVYSPLMEPTQPYSWFPRLGREICPFGKETTPSPDSRYELPAGKGIALPGHIPKDLLNSDRFCFVFKRE